MTDGSQVPALSAVTGGDPCLGAGTTPASCAPSGRLGPLLRHGEVPLLPGCGRLPDMRTVPRGPFLHAASSPGARRVPRGRLAFSLPRAVASLTHPEAFHPQAWRPGWSVSAHETFFRCDLEALQPVGSLPRCYFCPCPGRSWAASWLLCRWLSFFVPQCLWDQGRLWDAGRDRWSPGWLSDATRSRPGGFLHSSTDVAAALGIWCHFRSMDGQCSWLPRACRLVGRQKSEAGGWEGEQGWPRPSLSPRTLQPCSTRAEDRRVSGVHGAGSGCWGEWELGMHVWLPPHCALSCCGAEGGLQMVAQSCWLVGRAHLLQPCRCPGWLGDPSRPVDAWGPRKPFLWCSSGILGFTPGPDP